MPEKQVTIKADGYTSRGVHVYLDDKEITHITSIEIDKIEPDSVVKAKIEILPERYEIQALADIIPRRENIDGWFVWYDPKPCGDGGRDYNYCREGGEIYFAESIDNAVQASRVMDQEQGGMK